MKSYRLDTRVTLERPVQTDAGGGVSTTDFEDVASVWAHLEPLSGREYYAAQQTRSSTSHECFIRQPVEDGNGDEVKPTSAWRLTVNGRVFEILGVTDPDEQGFWWKLRLVEEVER